MKPAILHVKVAVTLPTTVYNTKNSKWWHLAMPLCVVCCGCPHIPSKICATCTLQGLQICVEL